jgi:Ca2+-dependent lipid-binding protein
MTFALFVFVSPVFTLNLEQLLSGAPLDTAIGVLQLKISNARGLRHKPVLIGVGGAPDPYVKISLAGRQTVARTATKHNDFNPAWNETKFILVSSLSEVLSLTVWDANEVSKDVELGVATFELERLKEDGSLEGLEANILDGGKVRGELRFDAYVCSSLFAVSADNNILILVW